MIEIKFTKQLLTKREKERYSQIIKGIIAKISLFNRSIRLLKDVVSTELKIIFK